MADGSSKRIEDVKVGERVRTFGVDGGYSSSSIMEVENPLRQGYYKVTLDDQTVLDVTSEHPLFFKNDTYSGWGAFSPEMAYLDSGIQVALIKKGDYLLREDRTWSQILGYTYVEQGLQTYNLILDGDEHTYFANKVYAHNKNGCSDSNPAAPVLVSPPDTTTCFTSNTITLDWNAVSSWGTNCGGNTNTYKVYVDGAEVASVSDSVTSYDYTGSWNTSHTWYIKASNGARTTDSPTWGFTVDSCSRIVGRVWEDLNSDNTYSGYTEVMSDNVAPGNTCAPLVNGSIDFLNGSGTSIVGGWECNSWPAQAYYWSWDYDLNGAPGTLRTVGPHSFVPPSNDTTLFPCAYASWTFSRCTNLGCTNTANSSGTTCVVNSITIGNDNGEDWSNHLHMRWEKNRPPLATITSVPQVGHTTTVNGQPVNYYITGSSQSFTASATDTRANLTSVGIGMRPFNPTTRVVSDPFTSVGVNNSCSGTTCSATYSSAVPAGYSVYYSTAQDEYANVTPGVSNRCNGNPQVNQGIVTDWADCDPTWTDGYQDETVTRGVELPACAPFQNWPTEFIAANQLMTFSSNAKHPNGARVDYDYDVTCGDFPLTGAVTVEVTAGGVYGLGDWPDIRVYATTDLGQRLASTIGEINSDPDTFTYTFNLAAGRSITMVEVAFINDASNATEDRNVKIYNVEVRNNLAPPNDILYAFQPHDGTDVTRRVYYDTGTYFDGRNNDGTDPYTVVNDPNDTFKTDHVMMYYGGALRFPMMWRGPAAPGSCDITLNQNVPLPYYNGPVCTGSLIGVARTITGHTYETQTGYPTCGSLISINNTLNPIAQIFNGATPLLPTGTVSGDSFSITPLFRSTIFDSICINGILGDGTKGYVLQCVNGTGVTCTAGSGACAVNCTPTNALDASDINIDLLYLGFDNEKWFTFLDGDFYSSGVVADITTDPGDNFTSNFINTQTNTAIGGFGFAGTVIDPQRVGSGVSESGGFGQQLNVTGIHDFEDDWFNNFGFEPPASATTGVPGGNVFQTGSVYNITVSDFNTLLTGGSYLMGGNVTGVAVVYVTGGGDININNSFTCGNCGAQNRIILVVTESPVNVDASVAVPSLATYSVSSAPQIHMGIVTSSNVEFPSVYDWPTQTFDMPVVITGPVLSRSIINFDRNLGFLNNYSFPAEMIRYYSRMVYWLTRYEVTNTGSYNFTGLATYDVQWVYSEP
jgi:hypothetical protein